MDIKAFIEPHAEALRELNEGVHFTVFLCGPALDSNEPTVAATLRQKISDLLKDNDFEVVLGEDEGLEDARLNIGLNAQDNELKFISDQCNAVVVIADSVGSFCELGLFTWHFVHKSGVINNAPTFIVLIKEEHSPEAIAPRKSYFNEGPIRSLKGFSATSFYVDFDSFDTNEILKILKNVRTIKSFDRRDKPRGTDESRS